MRIFITGIAGFIGSHLGERLLKEGHEVIGIDNFDPFYPKTIKENNLSPMLYHNGFHFIEGDLCNIDTVKALFAKRHIDCVVHLAAKAGVLPSLKDPMGYINNNIAATNNVLEVMKDAGCKKMVFASSSSIYGNNKEIPFSEADVVDKPISPYAFTKKSCELMNHNYHHLYDFDILNLRFFTVYGPRQRPDLAIHKFTAKILNDEPIAMYGDGSTARDYTFVHDTVQGIVNAIDYTMNHENVYEIINLGNNQPVKLKLLIDSLYTITGKAPNVKQQPMQPGDVDITFANIEKAKALLGYDPKTSIQDGLQQFIDWFKEKKVVK